MAGETGGGDRIVYTTKEILADINDKLVKNQLLVEQMDRRLTMVEQRVGNHDKVLSDQLPKLTRFMEEMNVQQAVEAALESSEVGVTNRDRLVVGIFSLAILALSLISLLPKVIGG